jgi:hypothetical protein
MSDTPARYRKRPVEVTACQWTGENFDVVDAFAGWSKVESEYKRTAYQLNDRLRLWIDKSQTWGMLQLGDWVIAERDGVGFYPCVAEQFAETYEPVEE